MNDNSHNNRGGHNSQAPDSLNLALPDLAASPEGNLWNSAIGRRTFLKRTGAATVATAIGMHGFRVQVQASVTNGAYITKAEIIDKETNANLTKFNVEITYVNGTGKDVAGTVVIKYRKAGDTPGQPGTGSKSVAVTLKSGDTTWTTAQKVELADSLGGEEVSSFTPAQQ